MTVKRQILYVDDEQFMATGYIRELRQLYDVVLETSAYDAVSRFRSSTNNHAIVLDIMMPSPAEVDPVETEDGLSTGIWFLRSLTDIITERRTAIIVLTNRDKRLVEEAIAQLSIPKELIIVKSKIDTPRTLLVEIVNSHMSALGSR